MRKWYYLPATKQTEEEKKSMQNVKENGDTSHLIRPSNSVAREEKKKTRSQHECEHEHTYMHTHTARTHTSRSYRELREILLEVINLLKANQDTTN